MYELASWKMNKWFIWNEWISQGMNGQKLQLSHRKAWFVLWFLQWIWTFFGIHITFVDWNILVFVIATKETHIGQLTVRWHEFGWKKSWFLHRCPNHEMRIIAHHCEPMSSCFFFIRIDVALKTLLHALNFTVDIFHQIFGPFRSVVIAWKCRKYKKICVEFFKKYCGRMWRINEPCSDARKKGFDIHAKNNVI